MYPQRKLFFTLDPTFGLDPLYILYSETSHIYYIGSSEDPWERFKNHNHQDKTTFTSKHRPWQLKAIFKVGQTRVEALTLERWLKKQKSRTLIEKLIDPGFRPTGKLAQLVRVP
ncbi:hypothetical protein DDV96_15060 [Marixanthomonas spongiae]|uniref:GIY-YIG domain-containing protein n=1 Tax=Marixanthomonas spongiae TaxID=2174845 RepID=A0A2U0HU86_9FLAO|nr:hypothetical protein DDV96_15060 [Marixanthomonas spongiae]